jgi:hypothetical protein
MKKLSSACLIVLTTLAVIGGALTLLTATATPAMAKCGICPRYCIGVTCDDGRTYCNACIAGCAGAHHCVVTG